MGMVAITLDIEDVDGNQAKVLLGKVQDFVTANSKAKLTSFNFTE